MKIPINFRECKIFNNIHHFRDALSEYKVKHGYHLKITICKKKKKVIWVMGKHEGYTLL